MNICKKPIRGIRPLILCIAIAGVGSGVVSNPIQAAQVSVATEVQQQRLVSGLVLDENGEPVIGANILIKGTDSGVITDIEGKFHLNVPSGKDLLEISYVGYKTQEVSIKGKNDLTVRLLPSNDLLDEVVVVGYGTQKKINLTGAVQSISNKDLVKRSVPNSSQALQGLIPGVLVTQSSGAPGAEAGIQVRGVGSINTSASPLILIDGIEGDMNSIDMNAIESISVLKDASSAAIYGSKAANGVVLVTTKRAANEGVKLSYNGFVGFRTPTTMPTPVDAIQYMKSIDEARGNQDMLPQYGPDIIKMYEEQGPDNVHYFDTNWRDLIFKDITMTHNHSVSLSGGSKNIRTFANASYNFEDGLVPNTNYNRKALRSNTDAKITDWMSVGLDLNMRRTDFKSNAESSTNIIRYALNYTPVFAGINADGTYGNGQNGINPYAMAHTGYAATVHNDLSVKGTLKLNPLKGLEGLVSYASRRYDNRSQNFLDTYDTYEAGNFIMSYPTTGKRRSESVGQLIRNQFNAQITYENTFAKKHYLKAFVGFQSEEVKNNSLSAGRSGFNYDGYNQLMHGDVKTATASGSRSQLAMMSWIARLNYAFADRYLIELTGRYDGSSRFTPDNRWGFFPAGSIGWRISEESFFENAKEYVNNLKIRASYGTLGNQELSGYYPYAATLGSGVGYWFDDEYTTGLFASTMSNPAITWEKSTQANFGLDATALDSRLNVSFDYYIRNISDMLQRFPIPMFVGLGNAWQNAGDMRNNGWDLSIGWRDKIGKVNYSVTAIISDVKNKITNLYGNKYINSNNTTQEGFPIYSWYGYVADGYFQSREEINESPVYGGNKNNIKPGFIKYKDISGPNGVPDGLITDEDRTIIGDPQPRYSFSLNLAAEWNNFDFGVFFQGIGKRDIYFEGTGARPFYVGGTIFEEQLDTWTETNRDAKFPLLIIDGGGKNANNIPSSFWVKSGAYLRLKNLTIGYTIPKKVLNNIKVDHLRFYASGQNLFTISNAYKGYDPESSVGGFYPVMQVFTLGVDVRF